MHAFINNTNHQSTVDKEALQNDFLTVSLQHSENRELIKNCFNKLTACYEAPLRHYHNLNHVVYILKLAQKNRHLINHWDSFYYAAWFHDAIQKVGINNESASTKYAWAALNQLNVPAHTIEKCEALILKTRHHNYVDCHSDGALFIDCDIAILGESPYKYNHYRTATRKEYPIPEFIYKYGRIKFLNKMLTKKRLFQTEHFRNIYEESARKNIKNELLTLKY